MNVSDFLNFLQNPDTVLSAEETGHLADLLKEYPYFQAARALYLKGLKNQESYKYNDELKRTAAYTTDREVLFDFITAKELSQKTVAEKPNAQKSEVNPTTNNADVEIKDESFAENGQLKKPESDKTELTVEKNQVQDFSEKELSASSPSEFYQNEKHSFIEWLRLTSEGQRRNTVNSNVTEEKKKKFELLDKFIEKNPKIVPTEGEGGLEINIKDSIKLDKEEVMTETLAKIYLEQKKYKKAIKAYEILSLKNPEKSSFFADRIEAAKKLLKEKE